VADRGSKAPFDPERRVHARLKRQALENGLLCYPMGGTIDGRQGDHVLIAPPYIVEESHLHELVDKLAASLAQVLAS
jgi:adenosylmethionine-8-amino-7-oxononanoate aminotransferase